MDQPLASPSLWRPDSISPLESARIPTQRNSGAFEIKFVVDQESAFRFRDVVSRHMPLDPNADIESGSYRVEGIYTDTAEGDVYRKTPGYSRHKYRIRRYSEGKNLFLERKSKRKGRVRKRRYEIAPDAWLLKVERTDISEDRDSSNDLDSFEAGKDENDREKERVKESNEGIEWFHRSLKHRRLQPKLVLGYQRMAFMSLESSGPIRLTIDREISCYPILNWTFREEPIWKELLPDQCVIEMKYCETVPSLFRRWIEEWGFVLRSFSKYRAGMEIAGLST